MSKSKKYNCRVVQNGAEWTAEIIRLKTSKETIVSKSKGGFSSEAEAQIWGQTELQPFLKSLKESNKRHNEKRGQG
ncbi:MAG: DUF3622 domain-containing protein [Gammaproteobacteria bacterium]